MEDHIDYLQCKLAYLQELLSQFRLSASGHPRIVAALTIAHLPGRSNIFEFGLVMPLLPQALDDYLWDLR